MSNNIFKYMFVSTRCPTTMDALVEKLHNLIGEFKGDYEVEFYQWTTKDRSYLTHYKEPVFEYIELVCKKTDKTCTTPVFGEELSSIPEIKKGRYK